MSVPALVPRAGVDWITERQLRLGRGPAVNRTFLDYLRSARWWQLEALRGYSHKLPPDFVETSSQASARYARNMRWAAELALLCGPGTWIELEARR